MSLICLIHWNAEEGEASAAVLQRAGYEVEYGFADGPAALRSVRELSPDAIVIDLNRLPSHGKETAFALRQSKRTRLIPLVFIRGDAEKTKRIHEALPDAAYTDWNRIDEVLKTAIAHPPANRITPPGHMQRYANTPLAKKLGIVENLVVVLSGAPDHFEPTLGELPSGVKLKKQLRGRSDLIVWFVRSVADLEKRIDRMAESVGAGGLWIAWPKKKSGVETDLTQALVRKIGMAAGLVDYKICSVDDVWSALRFSASRR